MTDKVAVKPEVVYESIDEIIASGVTAVEYRTIDGFTGEGGKKIRIGSVSAGEMIAWSEAGDNNKEQKRLAGLRLICQSLVGPEPDNRRYAATSEGELQMNMAKLRPVRHKETERILKEILDLNGMKSKEQDAAAKKD